MTLSEFKSKFFSRPRIPMPTMLYVFRDEESADNWMEEKYFGIDHQDYEFLMVLQSDMKAEFTVKRKWCNAIVQQFYAVEPDVIVVVIEEQEDESDENFI